VQAHPTFLEARAELLVALMLELDDARFEGTQRKSQQRAAQRTRESLEQARAPEGREQRVRQLREAEQAHGEASAQLLARAEDASSRAEAQLKALVQAPLDEAAATERVAVVRAQALRAAVHGGPGAPALIETLRASGEAQGWDVIAQAEYALNAARVSPELRREATTALEALRQRDASFLRAYVLGARLALDSGERQAAASLADMALALNPAHEVARGLKAMAPEGNLRASPAP